MPEPTSDPFAAYVVQDADPFAAYVVAKKPTPTPEQIVASHRPPQWGSNVSEGNEPDWKTRLGASLESAANPQTVRDIVGLLIPGQIEGAMRTASLYGRSLKAGFQNRPPGDGGFLRVPEKAIEALRKELPSGRMATGYDRYMPNKSAGASAPSTVAPGQTIPGVQSAQATVDDVLMRNSDYTVPSPNAPSTVGSERPYGNGYRVPYPAASEPVANAGGRLVTNASRPVDPLQSVLEDMRGTASAPNSSLPPGQTMTPLGRPAVTATQQSEILDNPLTRAGRSTGAPSPSLSAPTMTRTAAPSTALSAADKAKLVRQGYTPDVIARLERQLGAERGASGMASHASPTRAATPPSQPVLPEVMPTNEALQQPRLEIGAEKVGRGVGMTKEEVRQAAGPRLREARGDASPVLPDTPFAKMLDTLKALPKEGDARDIYVDAAKDKKTQEQLFNMLRQLRHFNMVIPAAASLGVRDQLMRLMASHDQSGGQ